MENIGFRPVSLWRGVSLMRRTRRMLTSAFLVVAAVAAVAAPAAAPAAAPEKKPTGKLEASVVIKGGGALQNCSLYLKNQALELGPGATTAVFEDVPVVRAALAGDATVKTPGGEIKRYVGIEEVALKANKTVKVTLTLAETTDMDAFCSGCHPGPKDPVEKGQIVRDIHVSGKILGKKYLDQVARHNAQVEKLVKERKPHNLKIVLEKRMVVEGGKTVEREFYTCESCHTLHWERGDTSYARAPFRKRADLCQGCHP